MPDACVSISIGNERPLPLPLHNLNILACDGGVSPAKGNLFNRAHFYLRFMHLASPHRGNNLLISRPTLSIWMKCWWVVDEKQIKWLLLPQKSTKPAHYTDNVPYCHEKKINFSNLSSFNPNKVLKQHISKHKYTHTQEMQTDTCMYVMYFHRIHPRSSFRATSLFPLCDALFCLLLPFVFLASCCRLYSSPLKCCDGLLLFKCRSYGIDLCASNRGG